MIYTPWCAFYEVISDLSARSGLIWLFEVIILLSYYYYCDWHIWSCLRFDESTLSTAAAAAQMPPPTDYTLYYTSYYIHLWCIHNYTFLYLTYWTTIVVIIRVGPIVTSMAAVAAVSKVALGDYHQPKLLQLQNYQSQPFSWHCGLHIAPLKLTMESNLNFLRIY